jgi:hypothetical protein
LKAEQPKRQRCDVVREAVLAGEQIEKLALRQRLAVLAHALAELARLAKHFFVRHRPRGAGYWDRDQQQQCELMH